MASGIPTYNDMYLLGQSSAFQNRVQAALIAACVNIASEGFAVAFHRERALFVTQILSSQTSLTSYIVLFSYTVATNATVIGDATVASTNYTALTAGNTATQQALILDTDLFNALAGQFNSFIREPGF